MGGGGERGGGRDVADKNFSIFEETRIFLQFIREARREGSIYIDIFFF